MKAMCTHEKQVHVIGDHSFLYCAKCNSVWLCKPLIDEDDPE